MARPFKRRHICSMPGNLRFQPHAVTEDIDQIVMTVDEYECIRLMDYEKMTQAECAEQMKVARTTVQSIYEEARQKISRFLVEGCELLIAGGHYELCDADAGSCGMCCPRDGDEPVFWRNEIMKIAVTYDNGEVFQHFGHTEQFKIYEVDGKEIKKEEVVGTEGSGHGALAGFLRERDVDTLICGGIGGGAQNALASAGIRLYGGVKGKADDAVRALLEDNLVFDANVKCDHHGEHGHGEGHSCGEHGHMHGEGHGCGGHGEGHGGPGMGKGKGHGQSMGQGRGQGMGHGKGMGRQ